MHGCSSPRGPHDRVRTHRRPAAGTGGRAGQAARCRGPRDAAALRTPCSGAVRARAAVAGGDLCGAVRTASTDRAPDASVDAGLLARAARVAQAPVEAAPVGRVPRRRTAWL